MTADVALAHPKPPALAHPKPAPRTYCVTKALDGEGNHIGYLLRQGGTDGPILERFARSDWGLRDAHLHAALRRVNPADGFIAFDELLFLWKLTTRRQWTENYPAPLFAEPTKGLAGCLAKGWIAPCLSG